MSRGSFSFYEFFAGGGMARIGLGPRWSCLFANDFDAAKAATYRANFADETDHLREGDVWNLAPADLPGRADLAWASSPCQDFSLAGARAGLGGGRSGAFYGFWRLMQALADEGRAPRLILIENVSGLLNSHGGADFATVAAALKAQGYRFGALEIDAAAFVPQSRPRVFIVATSENVPPALCGAGPWQSKAVRAAHERLPADLQEQWIWWRVPQAPARNTALAAVLEDDAPWDAPERTARWLELMSPLHRERLEAARARGERVVGAIFRRMREEGGRKVQRAELRLDGLAGCLRTPRGGSSRQVILSADKAHVRTRLLTPREAARLMGLPDTYVLPGATTAALHVAGDGVAVPVVRWLAEHLLEPLLGAAGVMAAE